VIKQVKKLVADAKETIKKEQKEATEFPREFTLAELTKSNTAKRLGIDNTPKGQALENLRKTAWHLVKVRETLSGKYHNGWGDSYTVSKPVLISSGYRSPELNKHIPGSSNTSAHTLGWAADFTCPEFGTPYEVVTKIAASPVMEEVDQLIYEYGSWVHISFDPRKRKQILTIDKNGTRSGIHI
jgi:uncharacterized protein YcbK (DUF882 family)